MLTSVGETLSALRRVKSDAKVKQRTEILSARVTGPSAALAHVEAALGDISAATRTRVLDIVGEWNTHHEISVHDVVLDDAEPASTQ